MNYIKKYLIFLGKSSIYPAYPRNHDFFTNLTNSSTYLENIRFRPRILDINSLRILALPSSGFFTVKNSQKDAQNHPGLLPQLQQCSGNSISTATTVGELSGIEVPSPEHFCSNGSEPGWVLGPFWLPLTAAIQAGLKKIKFRKKNGGYTKTRLPGSFFYPIFFQPTSEI